MALNERERLAWKRMFENVLEKVGPEKYEEFVLNLAEAYEDVLRELKPDSVALKLLDEHRRKQRHVA